MPQQSLLRELQEGFFSLVSEKQGKTWYLISLAIKQKIYKRIYRKWLLKKILISWHSPFNEKVLIEPGVVLVLVWETQRNTAG